MSRYAPAFFDINQPLFVRTEFFGSGRLWLPGMLFDWKHFKVDPFRVKELFMSSYLCHAAQESLDVADNSVAEHANPASADPIPHSETSDSKPAKYEIRQVGGPYYDVISPEGKVVNHKSLHKSKAESYAAKLNSGANTDEATTTELTGDTANG